MKLTLKLTAAFLFLQLCTTSSFAQRSRPAIDHANKTYFIGYWELSQAGAQGGQLNKVGPGYLKIFNADGTFTNIQTAKTGAVITHSGQFSVNTRTDYTEVANYRVPQMIGGPLGRQFPLSYEFSADKKFITINYTLESGGSFTEVWKRL
jgi:hypothetical protein